MIAACTIHRLLCVLLLLLLLLQKDTTIKTTRTVVRARDGRGQHQSLCGVVSQLSALLAAGELLRPTCHPGFQDGVLWMRVLLCVNAACVEMS